jgi:hypothetical protein
MVKKRIWICEVLRKCKFEIGVSSCPAWGYNCRHSGIEDFCAKTWSNYEKLIAKWGTFVVQMGYFWVLPGGKIDR